MLGNGYIQRMATLKSQYKLIYWRNCIIGNIYESSDQLAVLSRNVKTEF